MDSKGIVSELRSMAQRGRSLIDDIVSVKVETCEAAADRIELLARQNDEFSAQADAMHSQIQRLTAEINTADRIIVDLRVSKSELLSEIQMLKARIENATDGGPRLQFENRNLRDLLEDAANKIQRLEAALRILVGGDNG